MVVNPSTWIMSPPEHPCINNADQYCPIRERGDSEFQCIKDNCPFIGVFKYKIGLDKQPKADYNKPNKLF